MKSNNKNYALVDNWLMELACRLLDRQVDSQYFGIDSYRGFYGSFGDEVNERFVRDKLVALLQLLDLIVVSDKLVYDADWAHIWSASEVMKPIAPILSTIRLGAPKKMSLGQDWIFPVHNDTPEIVREGALYYLALSNLLGVYYWPSPQRTDFLRQQVYSRTDESFALELTIWVQNSYRQIVNEALSPLKLIDTELSYSGFGVSILQNCQSRDSILTTAMQFRDTKECEAFRTWLREVDTALESGDIKVVSKAVADVKDILEFVRAGLGITKRDEANVEFQVGLSPSINMDIKSLKLGLKRWKPKPLHIVFLRNHFDRVIRSSNSWKHIPHLFPELAKVEPSSLIIEK